MFFLRYLLQKAEYNSLKFQCKIKIYQLCLQKRIKYIDIDTYSSLKKKKRHGYIFHIVAWKQRVLFQNCETITIRIGEISIPLTF